MSSEDLEQDNYEFNNDTISPRNLHSTNSQFREENETPTEVKNIFQAAQLVFASLAADPRDIGNFRWKKATILHKEIATCFQATAQLEDLQFPLWFSESKTTLITKPDEFKSDNQRPITCLNNL